MITRIYAHNFRSLINFELKPEELALFLGPNGAGKSSLLDLLEKLNRLTAKGERLHDVFPPSDRSEMSAEGESRDIRVELDIQGNGGCYSYQLKIEYSDQEQKQRIQEERLLFNGKPLFEALKGVAHLYWDNHTPGPVFPMDWSQSGISFLMPHADNTRLTWFKERMQRIRVIRLNPFAMNEESRQEAHNLEVNASNFADWYRHLVQAHFEKVQDINIDLQERLPGFKSLNFAERGEARLLYARFENGQQPRINSLSEGQKALIALYSLLHGLANEKGATLCIDEPENFLALPEIQPWLDTLVDCVDDDQLQAFLVSHHPRLINYLAAGKGFWIERQDALGPSRVIPISAENNEGPLRIDQLIERGWIHVD